MVLNIVAGLFAFVSLLLLVWQWLAGWRFPLNRRHPAPTCAPAVTVLKPLKGCDPTTLESLRTWVSQQYPGPVQILFGVGDEDDPVTPLVRGLMVEFPNADLELVLCDPNIGANAKVSKLIQLETRARHDLLVVSDADVRVPPDLLAQITVPLADPATGLVNCFYRLASPANWAMRWEALAVNADFWSQVLQSRTLRPLDFALGAVMAFRREVLREIGGFSPLRDCLADDYQIGHRIGSRGYRVELSTVVAECWSAPMTWRAVWAHQLRWARTVRICRPLPYFFSIFGNPTLWPALWAALNPCLLTFGFLAFSVATRIAATSHLQSRFASSALAGPSSRFTLAWIAPAKDLLQAPLWLLAFAGNTVVWRGRILALRADGSVVPRS